MKHALYFQDEGPAKLLVVLKENSDGTVDLGTAEDKPAVVTNCKVVTGSKVGCCAIGKVAEGVAAADAAARQAAEKAAEVDAKAVAAADKADAKADAQADAADAREAARNARHEGRK